MLSWSNRRGDDEPGDLPDHIFIRTEISVDSSDPAGPVATASVVADPLYFAPVREQEPGVIEPTALYKPRSGGKIWVNIEEPE